MPPTFRVSLLRALEALHLPPLAHYVHKWFTFILHIHNKVRTRTPHSAHPRTDGLSEPVMVGCHFQTADEIVSRKFAETVQKLKQL
jgi:hypothetical protein